MKLLKLIVFLFFVLQVIAQEEYHFYSNQIPKKIESEFQLIKSEQKLYNLDDSLGSIVLLSYQETPALDQVKIIYSLKTNNDSLILRDTLTLKTKLNSQHVLSFQIKLPLSIKKGTLEVQPLESKQIGYFKVSTDYNYSTSTTLTIDCLDPNTKEKLIVNELTVNDSLYFKSPTGKVFIDFYAKKDFKQCPPPMAKNYTKPSIPKAKRIVHNSTKTYPFKEEGLYIISSDTIGSQPNKILVTNKSFPRYSKAEELIKPLVYITTKEEYEKLSNSKTPKASLDSFWIELAGNTEYAKKLIKIFYDRVYYSNENYSQFTEGWKTDKGMIFIVFGRPDRILFDENGLEDWQYDRREETNYVFKKINHPFDSQYSFLERNKEYDISWYPTIERWRKGLLE